MHSSILHYSPFNFPVSSLYFTDSMSSNFMSSTYVWSYVFAKYKIYSDRKHICLSEMDLIPII